MDFARTLLVLPAALALVAAPGCMSMCDCRERAASGATAAAPPAPTSGLPNPAGPGNLPRPSGPPGGLKLVDWAGFRSAVSYTFDDGQPSHIEHYAELQATGVRMTFFLNSSGTSADPDFVSTFTRAARDGHEIGNHTAHHCHAEPDGTLYTLDSGHEQIACPGASAGAEYDECTAFIKSALGVPHVWTAASPFGNVGFEPAAAERFLLNRGVVPGTIAPGAGGTDPFNLPMWGPAENDTVDAFDAAIDGARASGRWIIMLLHSIAPTTSRWYATVDISAITGSIAHAKSLGDVWIDSMANVGAYWVAQRILSLATPVVSGRMRVWAWSLPHHFPTGKYLRVTVDGGTLYQRGRILPWDGHGYYEIELDVGSLTLAP